MSKDWKIPPPHNESQRLHERAFGLPPLTERQRRMRELPLYEKTEKRLPLSNELPDRHFLSGPGEEVVPGPFSFIIERALSAQPAEILEQARADMIAAHEAAGFRPAQVQRWPNPSTVPGLDVLFHSAGQELNTLGIKSAMDVAAATTAAKEFTAYVKQFGAGNVVTLPATQTLAQDHDVPLGPDVFVFMVRDASPQAS